MTCPDGIPSMRLNEGLPREGQRLADPCGEKMSVFCLNEGLPREGQRRFAGLSALAPGPVGLNEGLPREGQRLPHPRVIPLFPRLNEGLPREGQRPVPSSRRPGTSRGLNEGLPREGRRPSSVPTVARRHVASTKGCPVKGSDYEDQDENDVRFEPQRRAAP